MVERGRTVQAPHGVPSHRSSQRSYGTSSSSSHESRFLCKHFCRKFFGIMCTQLGVGSILVFYAVVGSFAFIAIEGNPELNVYNQTLKHHEKAVRELWNYTLRLNVLHKERWYANVNDSLYELQTEIINLIRGGYERQSVQDLWSFPASLMFCLSIFTMIGYGHMTPKTEWGKITTILYAVFGIPLYILFFMNVGKLFAKSFKFLYRYLYRCMNEEKIEAKTQNVGVEPAIIVPSTACIWVMIVYSLGGTIMYAEWEQWSYLNSCYFTFTSLAKIGVGDFVPGVGNTGSTRDNNIKLIITFLYLLIGMSLIAMCYTLMKETIMLKMRSTEQNLKEKMYYCGLRIGLYNEESPRHSEQDYRHAPIRNNRRTVRRH